MSSGVWRYSRHANYLGEVLFYLGNFLAGSASLGMPFRPLGRFLLRRLPFPEAAAGGQS